MKYLLLFIFSCTQKNFNQDMKPNTLRIGILQVNTVYPILIYKNENDEAPFDTIQFKILKTGETKIISKINLKPYTMSEGDSYEAVKRNISSGIVALSPQLKFIVLDITEKGFRVVTNSKSGENFVIRKDEKSAYYSSEKEFQENNCDGCPGVKYNTRWHIFETWERYLKRVEYITKEGLTIYDKPEGKEIFKASGNKFLPLKITEVNGEWIKLQKAPGREPNFDESKNYEGWTKWRNGDNLLIKITEQTYE